MAIQKFSVSRDDSVYEAWPDLVQTASGKLICIFTECEHHLNRTNSRIVTCESRDRGRTWSKKTPFTEIGTKEEYFNNARISRLPDGRLAVICDKVYGDENKKAEIYVWYGDGEGKEWSEPTRYDFCGIVPDKLRVLKSGRMLIAAHFKNQETGKLEQYLWYSDDSGETWSDRVTVAADPNLNLCEVSILECEDGALVAFLRENSALGYDILKVFSTDGGATWSPIYPTSMDCGHRPVSGFLADGRVMVTYRYIPRTANNVFAAFFNKSELFKTKREEQWIRIMPLDYDSSPAADLGYTGWTQFDDGEIYVVTYIKDDADKAQIRGYSFYPVDVKRPIPENTTDLFLKKEKK